MTFSCRLQGEGLRMVRKVIDFEAAKDRRTHPEDVDQAQGELRARLITVMVLSGLSDSGLTSITLNAVLTVLESKDDSLDEAKQRIASRWLRSLEELSSLSGRLIYRFFLQPAGDVLDGKHALG